MPRAHKSSLRRLLSRGPRASALALAIIGCGGAELESPTDAGADGAREVPSVDAAATARDAWAPMNDGALVVDAGGLDATAPATCGDGLLCESFEGAEILPTFVSPNCSGSGRAAIDESVAHSGGRSLRVDGGGGYCDHVFARFPVSAGDSLHVRFYVRLGAALGGGHVTFAAMHDSGDDRDLRLGGQNAVVVWNREVDDATLPELSPAGVARSRALEPGRFHCVEIALDARAGTLLTRIDGVEIDGLSTDGTPTHDLDAQWLRRAFSPRVDDLRLGWESYAGQAMTLWFDDLVIASSPVGCGE